MAVPPTRRRVERVHATVVDADGTRRRRAERLAGEEPLEIRVSAPGRGVVGTTSTMRTPGDDFALAAGLLLAEGVLAEPADIAAIRYCTTPPADGAPRLAGAAAAQDFNLVTVELTRPPRHELGERTLGATASCGVCGSASIDALCDRVEPVRTATTFAPELLAGLPDRLRTEQALFDETGGLHAAALYDGGTGALLAAAEDIGRHNALDKAIGKQFLAGALPAGSAVAVLSGRVSFELVQKAAAAGIPVICAVSAPSNLAVHTAERLGITLAGFVREGRMTLYSHPERVATAPAPHVAAASRIPAASPVAR